MERQAWDRRLRAGATELGILGEDQELLLVHSTRTTVEAHGT